jgi:hypothetical protein
MTKEQRPVFRKPDTPFQFFYCRENLQKDLTFYLIYAFPLTGKDIIL